MDFQDTTPASAESTARRTRWSVRRSREVLVASTIAFGLLLSHLAASGATAAPLAQDPTGNLGARIEQAATSLSTLGRPLAVLAVVLALIAYLAEPMLPDWARENRGAIGKAIICAIAIGIAPDIVSFFVGA